jgi:hypothetical protein
MSQHDHRQEGLLQPRRSIGKYAQNGQVRNLIWITMKYEGEEPKQNWNRRCKSYNASTACKIISVIIEVSLDVGQYFNNY